MAEASVRRLNSRAYAPLTALFVAAASLRPQLSGVGPLLPDIQQDLDVSHALAGLLAALPVLCMGVFALTTPRVLALVSPRAVIATCIVVIALAGLLRSGAPTIWGVLLLTIPFGVGAAILGATLPVAVKVQFSRHAPLATGTYATGINLGAAAAAALAIPLAHLIGGWRGSLAVMALTCAIALPTWLALTRGSELSQMPPMSWTHAPWTSSVAWCLALVFGLQAICFYGLNTWLASAYIEQGWAEANSGALVSALNLIAVGGVVLVPVVVDKRIDRHTLLVIGSSALLGAIVGLAVVPAGAWFWVIAASIALGVLFALSLTLAVDAASTPSHASSITAMQLGVGYTLAAGAPLALGIVRDSTGTFSASLWTLVGVAACLLILAVALLVHRDAGVELPDR